MKKFTRETGIGAVMMLDNVDTDQIIPGHMMMKVGTQGFGDGLFANWRYKADGSNNPDFVLNRPPFDEALFLVAGHNFGCGSSREHAVWAIRDFGIRAIIAPSFGAIFMRNCYNNGLLPLVLPEEEVAALSKALTEQGAEMSIDLEDMRVVSPDGRVTGFTLSDIDRQRLLGGLDQIGVTLLRDDKIEEYQRLDHLRRPWVYDVPG
ncbi:3-isopropylmalate dehydratase small subunit [Flavisphingomonas formosensis]|uniref:3-isopropylmalate dehydratase small subunit n=1 Tax=Flavisphingomonas formosensis TaxID=861534 RepID=UPI0012FA31FA|nr:3-isopropylmalate dehydratase small subunit [Sphingomonas formosensis]